MDFKDQLKQLAERIQTLKDQIHTEEATKTSLILPFIQALGYDVFNPMEVIPEMVCDIGTKKGEKIDYCIMYNPQNEACGTSQTKRTPPHTAEKKRSVTFSGNIPRAFGNHPNALLASVK